MFNGTRNAISESKAIIKRETSIQRLAWDLFIDDELYFLADDVINEINCLFDSLFEILPFHILHCRIEFVKGSSVITNLFTQIGSRVRTFIVGQ